jgi:SAM-dependent methyltransferase
MRAMKTNANVEQSALWNGPSGQVWKSEQALLDAMFVNFETVLTDAVTATGARRVLDVGCGSGATTLAIARHLGTNGSCTGIDISAPLVELARTRATRDGVDAKFLLADAQTHSFEGAPYDLAVSRFGVMFFDDPVAAFANLRGAMRAGGALRAIVFRAVGDNPFMTVAEHAAASLLPALPPRRPGPGQFAFADREYVERVLATAGWSEIGLAPIDVPCAFPARELVDYFTRLGPVGQALRAADDVQRTRAIAAIRAAFAPFVHGDEVRFNAACWMISAMAAPATR